MGFPQFAPGGEGGLIPSIQMPASNVSAMFPRTSSGGGSRAKVPAASYLAPYLVSGGIEALLNRQEPTVEEQIEDDYYTDRYPDKETRDIAILADRVHGVDPKQEKGFRGFLKRSAPLLADVLAGAAFGEEGGAQYGATAASIRQAKNLSEANRLGRKQAFITDKLKNTYTYFDVEDLNAAVEGGPADIRLAMAANKGGVWINDPLTYEAGIKAGKNYKHKNFVPIADEAYREKIFIKSSDHPQKSAKELMDSPYRQNIINFLKFDQDFRAREKAAMGALDLGLALHGELEITALARERGEGAEAPGVTLLGNVLNLGNDILVNFDQVAAIVSPTGKVNGYFATAQDVEDGKANGTGHIAKELRAAMLSGNEQQMELALSSFDKVVREENNGKSIRDFLGDAAYSNIKTRNLMLQLAYLSAAAYGQTGKTLSDKDLANFLKIVGFGASADPRVLQSNLVNFLDEMIISLDNSQQIELPQDELRQYPLTHPLMQGKMLHYFKMPSKDGTILWDDYLNYQPKKFYDRYGLGENKLEGDANARKNNNLVPNVERWQNLDRTFFEERKKKLTGQDQSPATSIADQIEMDLDEYEY